MPQFHAPQYWTGRGCCHKSQTTTPQQANTAHQSFPHENQTKINFFLRTQGPLHFHSSLDDERVMGPMHPHVSFIQTVGYIKRQNFFFHLLCSLKLPSTCLRTLGGGATNASMKQKLVIYNGNSFLSLTWAPASFDSRLDDGIGWGQGDEDDSHLLSSHNRKVSHNIRNNFS
jgi:hypothetical protein